MTRGEKNNNPGNIRLSAAKWQGKILGGDKEFECFDSPENGIRALAKILLNYSGKYGLYTIRDIVSRYAPSTENNTESYIAHVCKTMAMSRDHELDLRDQKILAGLVTAIILHENGRCIYSLEVITDGVGRAI